MIILKHVTIERFRLLRSMNLHFPQRGSILIQGPNEAGKSALIESLYFALYGEPLASRRDHHSLDDLISYGATSAVVTLALSAGATELTIARTIERGKGQSASLLIQQLGMPDEPPITDLAAVNARIISELGNLDGTTLRESGLVEQKGLTLLESISGSAREKTIRNLLGLDAVNTLSEQFQVEPEDEERLHTCSERLALAEIQARIPQLQEELGQFEVALDAVQVNEYLADIDQQEADISELEQSLEQIQARRLDLRSQQGRVQQLKRADLTLAEIIASYDDIAEARRELPSLEQRIAELERREREELPQAEKRVSDLAELTRSFGTLQRMSNDLLTAVDSIKDLEQDVREYQETNLHLHTLDEQINQARARLANTQKNLQTVEEQRRARRPQLEERLQRLQFLSERLHHLRQLEEDYTRRVSGRDAAEEHEARLQKVIQDLNDAQQELELAQYEAQQVQQQSDTMEKSWRQLRIRQQVEEWHRLKGLAQGLTQAEQHVHQARQQQESVTRQRLATRDTAHKYMLIMGGCGLGIIICLLLALLMLTSNFVVSIIAVVVMLLLIAPAYLSYQRYQKSRQEENTFKVQEQEAISRVQKMVAAREAAVRKVGNEDALRQVEQEITALGGSVPPNLEEAQLFLDSTRDQGDIAEAQRKKNSKLEELNSARDRVKKKQAVIDNLRQERSSLENTRKREQWDNMEENLQKDQVAVELMHQEITLLAGQENLPMPSINARIQASPIPPSQPSFVSGSLAPVIPEEDISGVPDLEGMVESTIKATEHEIASLDGKLDVVSELARQTKANQDSLDALIESRRTLEDRNARFKDNPPDVQIERAREQQVALSSALQSLKDSLRQRVKPLGVRFGQAEVGSAETAARRQLEELNITLGNKIMLQESHARYTALLRERQESLSEHYKQLAKFSNTLGSWIVPLNPFAEALVALRNRCHKELHEANEEQILRDLTSLQEQEQASNARIELCRQEIRGDQASISNLLAAHDLEQPSGYARRDLLAAWPLLEQHPAEDRQRLEDDTAAHQQELQDLQEQAATLAEKLHTGEETLDLEQARAQMEQEERSYQIKKYGYRLLQEAEQRLLRKVQPRTEYYMQQILPLLTGGRYHDVHLTTQPEEGAVSGGPFQIEVWDSGAGKYLPTSALSGGAADLFSLSLRLAFAIATLPGDLNLAPGFVLLDEPLSSFDRGRAQALVDVVSGDIMSQHFEQIILLSHSSAFDPAMFPYHIYMDNGFVLDSNLPIVAMDTVPQTMISADSLPFTPVPEDFDDEDDDDKTAIVAAIKLPSPNKK
ncbi:AAA family ATPase [Dictyobacter aurantiacus]|uniref:Nuclease SbcCD subunit C n=1 Tax=Dictyobacter aurantiacus TaxID=1936993 RepID=A0A401ZDE8_9CHLR|nr:AAA family ATPase [Dictyobacter aurantiacus]GCE04869.1 hypothetical protein KDAU_21980 [Dictyobacter aurantiacus]